MYLSGVFLFFIILHITRKVAIKAALPLQDLDSVGLFGRKSILSLFGSHWQLKTQIWQHNHMLYVICSCHLHAKMVLFCMMMIMMMVKNCTAFLICQRCCKNRSAISM